MTTKAKVNKTIKDAEKVDKIIKKIIQLKREINEIQKENEWTRYLGQRFYDEVQFTEEESQKFYEASQKIIYAHREDCWDWDNN